VSGYITAKEADQILENWAGQSLPVCFAVCMGNLAWHAHWVGKITNARGGRWVLTVGHTTNMLSTHEFEEIVLTEDEELVGIRFRFPKGLAHSGFEVDLFIAKAGGLDVDGPDVFVHYTGIVGQRYKTSNEGDTVEFVQDPKRPQAANVTRRALNSTPHNQVVMDKKKPHVPTRLTEYDPKNAPEWLNLMRQDVLKGAHVPPTYTTVVDQDRKYVDVSESFCKLVGYKIEELIGTRYDSLTALNTADIPMTHTLLSRLGYLHGLWMLVHRTGYRILIRYEARLRPDTNIQSNIEVLQTIV
jgi:PAS domain S-box-containing protein